jgi:hypothetical protein
MIYLNLGGEVLKAISSPTRLHPNLHPKFPLNPLSIYLLLSLEGVKGYIRRNKSLKKYDLFIFRKFGNLIFHPYLHLHPSPYKELIK